MTTLDDLRAVIDLACFTEDRTDAEQRALLRVAVRCDNEANALVTTNRRNGAAWRLVAQVESTRELVDGQREVRVEAGLRARVERRAEWWDRFHERYQSGVYDDEMRQAMG